MKSWNEVAKIAANNQLTSDDLNIVVLAIAGKMSETDARYNGLAKKVARNTRDMTDVKEEYPLLPPEADDLSKLVQKKGVEVMGGKKANAYKNIDLRKRIYRDIYTEIKRQYGLIDEMGRQQSYKKLKRKHLSGAFSIVDGYVLPIALANEVEAENELDLEG